jgi:hypothetical protein
MCPSRYQRLHDLARRRWKTGKEGDQYRASHPFMIIYIGTSRTLAAHAGQRVRYAY